MKIGNVEIPDKSINKQQDETPKTQNTNTDDVLMAILQQNAIMQDQLNAMSHATPTTAVAPVENLVVPEGFNPYDIHDPSTVSGKYYIEKQKRERDFLLQDVGKVISETIKEQESARAKEFAISDFQKNNDVDGVEMANFQKWLAKPDGANLDVLWDVYKIVNKKDNQAPDRIGGVGVVDKAKSKTPSMAELASLMMKKG